MILKGIDQIKKYDKLFKNKRIGLITSTSAVDSNLNLSLDIIREHYNLVALFAPEHGVRGNIKAGQTLESDVDPKTGIMVYSLYRQDSKKITDEMFEKIDLLIYDIQDVGVRYYTYISTMIMALAECAKHHKEFVILDRPNPLGGVKVEGDVLSKDYQSFVGAYDIPVRYGLTIGELATMVNIECGYGCELTVIPCQGWKREMVFSETNQVWIMPSPNIPNYLTVELYIGMCLFEGTVLSEGRGTTYPFGTIGAPFIDGEQLTEAIRQTDLKGLAVTPAYFIPSYSKFKGENCQGIHLHITDSSQFESYQVGVRILEIIKNMYSQKNIFLEPNKEGTKPFVSLLAGSSIFEQTNWQAESYLMKCEKVLEKYKKRKQKFHIYE